MYCLLLIINYPAYNFKVNMLRMHTTQRNKNTFYVFLCINMIFNEKKKKIGKSHKEEEPGIISTVVLLS